jgi:hypothetical protein
MNRLSPKSLIEEIPFNLLAIAGIGGLIADAMVNSSIHQIAILGATGLIVAIPSVLPKRKKWTLTPIAYLLTSGVLFFDTLSSPANAQFMLKAENWMKSSFSEASEIIPLIFNVLRGIFIIYLGFSLFQVINAGRQDEEWMPIAKKPLMIIVATTIADVLTGMIIGG